MQSHENTPKRPPLMRPEILFLSLFGVGFCPKAPGTVGSLVVLPFLFLLSQMKVPGFFILPLVLICTLVACFVAEYAQKKYGLHDPSWIVVDEALGMALAWAFAAQGPLPWFHWAMLFAFFRFYDIVKLGPVKYFDQRVKHGAGTILDDIVAGVFAGLTYRLCLLFVS